MGRFYAFRALMTMRNKSKVTQKTENNTKIFFYGRRASFINFCFVLDEFGCFIMYFFGVRSTVFSCTTHGSGDSQHVRRVGFISYSYLLGK